MCNQKARGLPSNMYQAETNNGNKGVNIPNTNEIARQDVSKEEKLRRRREQLAAFRLRKEQEKQETVAKDEKLDEKVDKKVNPVVKEVSTPEIEPTPATTPESKGSAALKLRQQRIEEWKKKRANKEKDTTTNGIHKTVVVPKKSKPLINLKNAKFKVHQKTTNQIKRTIAFDGEDDDDMVTKKKFKIPSEAPVKKPDGSAEDDDELDKYLETLSKESETKESTPVENITLGDVDLEDEEPLNDDQDLFNDEPLNDEEEQQKMLEAKLIKMNSKEKELNTVDHALVSYGSFRKQFYKEPYEILKLSREELQALKLDLGEVKLKGHNCPHPITKWSHLGLPSNIISIIDEKLKYPKPSSIQAQALPAIMSGRDVIGVAKTGSGKTLSFVLPMLRHIKDQEKLKKGDGPIGLIMTPTRELALQIYKEVLNFSKSLDLTACCCYGGSSIESQIAELKKGAEILIGTPGRIIDLLAANGGRVTNLRRVTYLVLDEADRMFDMGFEPQVTKVFLQVRPDRQTVLFSATLPRKMELLARKILQNPIEISIGGISVVAAEITQKVEVFDLAEIKRPLDEEKFLKLIEILEDFKFSDPGAKILIFVEKQTFSDELLVKLLAKKYACLTIHGGKEQMDRNYAIREFSSASSGVNILIATSIAARGLDVKGLNLVINYDAPNHMEDYVHRVGRTGRAGMKGTAITFIASDQERAINDLVRAMKHSKVEEIPPKLIEIADRFLENVKAGKEKYHFGFGGRGLDNLQEIRENNRDLQNKVYGEEGGTAAPKVRAAPKIGGASGGTGTSSTTMADLLPDFTIIEGRAPETSGPDKCKFHSRITINDLPQTARWTVVNRDSLSKIIENTSTSITNKGQFYPPNTPVPQTTVKNGKKITPPPKLYLLVEGLTEASVHNANNLIRQKMIEGLELAQKEESMAPVGKYKV